MRLGTERITLRELEARDLEAVLAYRERTRRTRPWLEGGGQKIEWLEPATDEVERPSGRKEIHLAILHTETDELIGACRIRTADATCREAELLLDFDPKYLKTEEVPEAVIEVLKLGFEELRLHGIWSRCISKDDLMARVLERAGMRVEDIQRRSLYRRGRWWDTVVYSILEAEWVAQAEERTTYPTWSERQP